MKNLALVLIPLVIFVGPVLGGDSYRKSLNIEPESSEWFSRTLAEKTAVTVQLSGTDLGSGRIVAEVYDPNGRKVATGTGRLSFNTKTTKGNYKIVVVNRSKKQQRVEISVNSSPSRG